MDLLYSTVEEYNIAPECIAGSDEIGFNSALIQRGRAIGPKGRKVLYQRNDGPRENITVIATILADGTTIPPSVIYKGDGYQVRWSENNPLNASIGHSKKGWTDGEIGVEWIKIFDEHTREKADGRDRLLLVDGHNSHYTEAFLAYAREHRIHVLCYPAHTTHVYQGLDVVVFAKLKTYWNEEKIKMQVRLTKSNFLQCLAPAWTRAMTTANIKSAFRKTGVYPLDRTTIKESDLAPSRATTTKTAMPLDPPEHVRILTSFFRDALRLQDTTPVPSATTDTTGRCVCHSIRFRY
ncbi:DDE-domain-containing protein [Peniophora sp. CONT]|nr:DDE-domain-containing protein [Peniophora sp. CONT]